MPKPRNPKTERHQLLMLLEYTWLHDGNALDAKFDDVMPFAVAIVRARMERLAMGADVARRSTEELFDEGTHPLFAGVPNDVEMLKHLLPLAMAKRDPEQLADYGQAWGPGPGIWRSKATGATERFLPSPLPQGWLPVRHRSDGGLQLEIGNVMLRMVVSSSKRLTITIGSDTCRPTDEDVAGVLGRLRGCHSILELDGAPSTVLEHGDDEAPLGWSRRYTATIGNKPPVRWRGKKKQRRRASGR